MSKLFQVTKDRKVLLDGHEVTDVEGFKILVEAAERPEVELRVMVDEIDVDEYTDAFTRKEGRHMEAVEFFHRLGTLCQGRNAECVGCEMRLFCYTPACAVTDDLVALVTDLLNSPQSRAESQDHSDHRTGDRQRPCPCEMDMCNAPGYELRR